MEGLLIDLSGVVYQGNSLIGGTDEGIERLRQAGVPFRFVTNTTSEPLSRILEKLEALGIPAERRDIFTPARDARSHLTANDLGPEFLVAPALLEDFADLPEGSAPAVVVGDAGEKFSYACLNRAFRQLQSGAELIALATNRMFLDADGRPTIDVGAFVAALEYASGKDAFVCGKPSAKFFHSAVADLDLRPEQVAMIGEDAEFDVSAAIDAGLSGILVKTGKGSMDSKAENPPTAEFDDLLQAVQALVPS